MAERLFESPLYPAMPTSTGALYPVHRIFCVGRNYADHAREMGAEIDREAPFYFLKDAQALVQTGSTITGSARPALACRVTRCAWRRPRERPPGRARKA